MRITNSGDYQFCRWGDKNNHNKDANISVLSPKTYFQETMATLRQAMLDGREISGCNECRMMEQHNKVSGRQKQLLKAGVVLQDFTKTMKSSPWIGAWKYSQDNSGFTDVHVQDWQIDLGNFCNSACLFCHPASSSRLASEHLKLNLISALPPRPWCDDPANLDKFIDTLCQSSNVQYLHFIGGETLITPGFRRILEAMITANLHRGLTLGFTTNLTVMDEEIVDLLTQFNQINLGVSVECLDRANDYIRYGGTIERTKEILDHWVQISRENKWLMQIRTTPTVLSIARLTSIYDYAWNNHLAVESCNFLDRPAFMKPSVLPGAYRQQARDRLQAWLDQHTVERSQTVINTRHPDFAHEQIYQDVQSYINYLDTQPDHSDLLPELVQYLKIMESSRGNSVLDYLPEYEELFRTAGY